MLLLNAMVFPHGKDIEIFKEVVAIALEDFSRVSDEESKWLHKS